MKLNKTLALALHRAMWTDMQTELGDNPSADERKTFKYDWIKRFFPDEHVLSNCFLCEFANACWAGSQECQQCPIRWPNGHCAAPEFSYSEAPISDILALPERDVRPTGLADITYDSYYKFREERLSKASGLPACSAIDDHIKAIKEKAVEEYFAKTPGAKLVSMDVDEAFKQYAKEQTEHYRKSITLLHDLLNKYKDKLSEESGLNRDIPVDYHIREIVKNSMEAGAAEERDRIQEKIYEELLS